MTIFRVTSDDFRGLRGYSRRCCHSGRRISEQAEICHQQAPFHSVVMMLHPMMLASSPTRGARVFWNHPLPAHQWINKKRICASRRRAAGGEHHAIRRQQGGQCGEYHGGRRNDRSLEAKGRADSPAGADNTTSTVVRDN